MLESLAKTLAVLALIAQGWVAWAAPATGLRTTPSTAPSAGDIQAMLERFEKDVSKGAGELAALAIERRRLEKEIDKLKRESQTLHQRIDEGSNVILEIRLKGVLQDLRSRLADQSLLEGRWESQRTQFSEKSLSLLSLYNDQIDREVASSAAFLDPASAERRLGALVDLARKRAQLLDLIQRYRDVGDSENAVSLDPAALPSSRDRESLELALRLLNDRKREVEERLERSVLQEQEILKEIRLQERMRELIDDVDRIRGNAGYSPGGVQRRDLEWFRAGSSLNQLKSRLDRLKMDREKDQVRLVQLEAYLDQVQYQIKRSGKPKGVRP